MFSMVLLSFILIKQFLLYYDYTYIYYLYMDMLLVYYCSKYNKYKKIENIYNDTKKILKNVKTSQFDTITVYSTSEYTIIITRKYICMLIYFFKFFVMLSWCFIVSFLFFYWNHDLFGMFYMCMEYSIVLEIIFAQGYQVLLAYTNILLWLFVVLAIPIERVAEKFKVYLLLYQVLQQLHML